MSTNPYKSPAISAETQSPEREPAWFRAVMAASAIAAFLMTIPVLAWAVNEPYFGEFKWVDALVMVVGGAIGTVFWCFWSIATVYAVFRRWWRWTALFFLLLAFLFGHMNYSSCSCYINDRQQWAEMQR